MNNLQSKNNMNMAQEKVIEHQVDSLDVSQLDENEYSLIEASEQCVIVKDTDSFVVLLNQGYLYVDKTLLLKKIINANYLFIAAPQRCGKSINISMIKAFFQTEGDDPNYYNSDGKYIFKGNKNYDIFKNLKIGLDNELFLKQHQGQYPVISLNFKTVKDFDNIKDLQNKLMKAISEAFWEHEYIFKQLMLNQLRLSKKNTKKFKNRSIDYLFAFLQSKNNVPTNIIRFHAYLNQQNLIQEQLNQGIEFLAQQIGIYYGIKRVIILIDEFDKPITSLIPKIIDKLLSQNEALVYQNYILEVSQTVTNAISSLVKGGSGIYPKFILTGIYDTLNKEVSAEVNIFQSISRTNIIDGHITSYFGFDDKDIDYILDKAFNFSQKPDLKSTLKEKLKYWYNGQIIENKEMYTPCSIINCIHDLTNHKIQKITEKFQFVPYWDQTSTNHLMITILKTINQQNLKIISVDYFEKINQIALENPQELRYNFQHSIISLLQKLQLDSFGMQQLFSSILIQGGYLTAKGGKPTRYGFPANEVKLMFQKNIIELYFQIQICKNNIGLSQQIVQQAEKIDFYQNDIQDSAKQLSILINLLASSIDQMNESMFEKILTMVFFLSKNNNQFQLACQYQSGKGFLDLVVYYKDRTDLYELKFVNRGTEEKVNVALEQAQSQILQNEYMRNVFFKIKFEESKKYIKSIRIIPLVLSKASTNSDHVCYVQEKLIRQFPIEQLEEMHKMTIDNDTNNIPQLNQMDLNQLICEYIKDPKKLKSKGDYIYRQLQLKQKSIDVNELQQQDINAQKYQYLNVVRQNSNEKEQKNSKEKSKIQNLRISKIKIDDKNKQDISKQTDYDSMDEQQQEISPPQSLKRMNIIKNQNKIEEKNNQKIESQIKHTRLQLKKDDKDKQDICQTKEDSFSGLSQINLIKKIKKY